jgi:hypothetical protein
VERLCPYFQQYMHCIITLPPFYDLTVQALKLIEQRFFDVVALVELMYEGVLSVFMHPP